MKSQKWKKKRKEEGKIVKEGRKRGKQRNRGTFVQWLTLCLANLPTVPAVSTLLFCVRIGVSAQEELLTPIVVQS